MSLVILKEALQKTREERYVWTMYFYKIKGRVRQEYITHKIRFTNENMLPDYASRLVNSVLQFQIGDKITSVEKYDGSNLKTSCDKISTDHELLKDKYDSFLTSIINAGEDGLENQAYSGYLFAGTAIDLPDDSPYKNIAFLKHSPPQAKIQSKSKMYFIKRGYELDYSDDNYYRLYFTVDSIILNNAIYSFSLAFEKVFGLEQTIKKHKNEIVEKILETPITANQDNFRQYINSFKNCDKLYLTFNQDRYSKCLSAEGRASLKDIINVETNEYGYFVIDSLEKARNLIDYLCMKRIKEADTNVIYKIPNATKVS